jgi:hypothetical protein
VGLGSHSERWSVSAICVREPLRYHARYLALAPRELGSFGTVQPAPHKMRRLPCFGSRLQGFYLRFFSLRGLCLVSRHS